MTGFKPLKISHTVERINIKSAVYILSASTDYGSHFHPILFCNNH